MFSRSKVRKYPDFCFGESILEVTYEYLYLGIMFSYNCLFNKAIHKHITQAKRAMFALITKGRRLLLPLDVLFELFDKMILPILTYGSEIYGINNLDKIEIFQRSFYKRIMKLSKSTPSAMIYGETGSHNISITIEKKMISYWLRLITGDPGKLNTLLYEYIYQMDCNNIYSTLWISKLKSILQKCGMFYIWVNQATITDVNIIKKLICKRIDDMWLQTWRANLTTHIRCSV